MPGIQTRYYKDNSPDSITSALHAIAILRKFPDMHNPLQSRSTDIFVSSISHSKIAL